MGDIRRFSFVSRSDGVQVQDGCGSKDVEGFEGAGLDGYVRGGSKSHRCRSSTLFLAKISMPVTYNQVRVVFVFLWKYDFGLCSKSAKDRKEYTIQFRAIFKF